MSHIANRPQHPFANRNIDINIDIDSIINPSQLKHPRHHPINPINPIVLSLPSSPSIHSSIADDQLLSPSDPSDLRLTSPVPVDSALDRSKIHKIHKIPKMPNSNRHHHHHHSHHSHSHHHHHRHHQNVSSSSSSSHHNSNSHTYPNSVIHDPLPAACTSLLSLRSGHVNPNTNTNTNTRPHNAARDGALPILTMALTLLEARSAAAAAPPMHHSPPSVLPVPISISGSGSRHSKHAHKPPSSHAAASGSRFWDTVLPPIPSPAPSTTRPPVVSVSVSAEDESAKMNIPCVVCGVRFRKPGHLNMHWRSVHATSSDAVYPGKLTSGLSVMPSVSVHAQPISSNNNTNTNTRITITKHASSTNNNTTANGRTSKASKASSNSSSGIRPYGCPQCASRFRRGSDRNRHMRMVHAKIRPFECTQCGSHFGRKSFLEAHISTVHEKQRPFRCECGAAFGQRSSLTRHARKIHGPS